MDSSTLLLLAVMAFVVYVVWDYIRNYLSKCRKCKGAGVLPASFWSRQYRPCPRCKRKGEVKHSFGPKG